MPETLTCTSLREYVNDPRHQGRIDRRRGVISGVKILGVASRNNRRYPLETLREAIPLYQDAKVNLNHPDGNPAEPRRYQDRFGLVRNVRVVENEGLFADFHFNPKHRYAEQLLWDAENAPENVGFSHNIEAEVARENDLTVVRRITAVRSVDLVADPATTLGLFESHGTPCRTTCGTTCRTTCGTATPCPGCSPSVETESRQRRQVVTERFCRNLIAYFAKKHPTAASLFGEAFLNSVFEEGDDARLEKRLAERFALAESLPAHPEPGSETRAPLSREQIRQETTPDNVKSFVEMISR